MAAGKTSAAASGGWLVFEDEAGFSMTPPTTRTWAPRGQTPVVTVRGRSRRRISIAVLVCYRPGHRSRLIYRPRRDSENRNRRKSFAWTDYRDLLICAHHQLGAPLVVVWDNLNTHLTPGMRQFAADHDWLTVYQLPAYAPDLNPVEVIWSLLRRSMANTAFTDPDHLIAAIRTGLKRIQHRPHLIDGCLAATGLDPANRS
ncbi:IS630 family transposase [Nocardia sp. NPDC088792]|uniref:IS630 family transposase n=1 Tax=Nocardia sp. NPDC088792 TaxID=3364332 RepID=UPI003812971F